MEEKRSQMTAEDYVKEIAPHEFGKSLAERLRELEVEKKKRELTTKIVEAMTDIMPDVVRLLKLMSEEDAYDDE